ncbi:hypothetical protein MASR2M78_01050 [Treponema sp.]
MKISFSRSPRLDFGPGAIQHLGAHRLEEEQRGNKRFKLLALITGNSFMSTPAYAEVLASLKNNGIEVLTYTRRGEPDPAFVDSTVASLIENVGLDETRSQCRRSNRRRQLHRRRQGHSRHDPRLCQG